MNTYYRSIIARVTPPDYDPRHVEAYIRLAHPTLDGLSYREFMDEVKIAIACVDEGGIRMAEENARSYGL